MRIKKNLKISTDGFWYDLTDGGYLKPEEICADKKDVIRIKEALIVLEDFRQSCEEQIKDFIR